MLIATKRVSREKIAWLDYDLCEPTQDGVYLATVADDDGGVVTMALHYIESDGVWSKTFPVIEGAEVDNIRIVAWAELPKPTKAVRL